MSEICSRVGRLAQTGFFQWIDRLRLWNVCSVCGDSGSLPVVFPCSGAGSDETHDVGVEEFQYFLEGDWTNEGQQFRLRHHMKRHKFHLRE